jgi:predicted XRE-type DNA-binding protein
MSKKRYEIGSPNVFKDLGLPNAEEHFIKAQLVFKIDTLIKERGLKQVRAAVLLGIKQPDVSKMLRGEFRQFSVERQRSNCLRRNGRRPASDVPSARHSAGRQAVGRSISRKRSEPGH